MYMYMPFPLLPFAVGQAGKVFEKQSGDFMKDVISTGVLILTSMIIIITTVHVGMLCSDATINLLLFSGPAACFGCQCYRVQWTTGHDLRYSG